MDYTTAPVSRRRSDAVARAAFDAALDTLQNGTDTPPALRRTWIKVLLDDLDEHSIWCSWEDETLWKALSVLKCLGRSSVATDDLATRLHIPLFHTRLITTTTSSSGTPTSSSSPQMTSTSTSTSQLAGETRCDALRIVSNALTLHPLARTSTILTPALYLLAQRATHVYAQAPEELEAQDTFLCARIVFIMTSTVSERVIELVESTTLCQDLALALSAAVKWPHVRSSQALGEWLKVTFNLTLQYPRSLKEFGHAPSALSASTTAVAMESTGSSSSSSSKTGSPSLSPAEKGRTAVRQFVEAVGSRMSRSSSKRSDKAVPSNDMTRSSSSEEEIPPDHDDRRFQRLLRPLVDLYLTEPISKPIHFGPPLNWHVQSLMGFPASAPSFLRPDASSTYPPSPLPPVLAKTLDIIDGLLAEYFPNDPDDSLSRQKAAQAPNGGFIVDEGGAQIMTLLLNLVTPGAGLPDDARRAVRDRVIPPTLDRSIGLDKQSNLIGRLLRMLNSLAHETMKLTCGGFLMALYDDDPSKLVSAVGYGPIAGYLTTIGANTMQPDADTLRDDLNPITGAHWTQPSGSGSDTSSRFTELAPLTEEEKIREAERLSDLFDRLNRTGVMKVQDPRGEAVQQGKLAEWEEGQERERCEDEERDVEEGLQEMKRYKQRQQQFTQGK